VLPSNGASKSAVYLYLHPTIILHSLGDRDALRQYFALILRHRLRLATAIRETPVLVAHERGDPHTNSCSALFLAAMVGCRSAR